MGAGTFREDLFHRLQVVHIDLPPLRERREDIPLLISHFIIQKRHRLKRPRVCKVKPEAMHLLLSYNWPGNVRELENVIETAIIECPGDTVEASHLRLSSAAGQHGPCGEEDLDLPFRVARERVLSTFEERYLIAQLRRYEGSIRRTAEHAGLSCKHVRGLIKRHVPLKGLSYGEIIPSAGSTVKQEITLQQGIPIEKAREIVKKIKDSKLKVQAAIQADMIRVSGRDRDTLQQAIALLRGSDFGIDMQFTNYRTN